jgi:hypothetical protein
MRQLLYMRCITDKICIGNKLSSQKVEQNIWKETDRFSKRYLNLVSGKISRCCKACLDTGDQHFKLLQKNTGSSTAREKQIQNSLPKQALYAAKFQNICIENKSHCTMLKHHKTSSLTKLVWREGNTFSARCSTIFGTLVARECRIICNLGEIRLTLMMILLNVIT